MDQTLDEAAVIADTDTLSVPAMPKKKHWINPAELRNELILVDPDATDILSKYRLPDMVVEIRPIDVVRWHKQAGPLSFSRPVTIEAFFDQSKGGYNTGLTEDEQLYLEAMTGLQLDNKFHRDQAHPFWSSAAGRVKLENQTQLININTSFNYIKYKLCKACTLVANSLDEYNQGIWFEATHFIHNEEERIQVEAQTIDVTRKAYRIVDKMTPANKRKLLQVVAGQAIANRSAEYVDVSLEDMLKTRPADILTYASLDPKRLSILSFIHDGVYKNILMVKKGGYYFNETLIGYNLHETADYMSNPKNQEVVLVIKSALDAKR